MANNLDSTFVNNYLSNAYTYGSNSAYFQASSQFLQLGKKISDTAQTCQTFSEWIFSEVETIANDVVKVLKIACKFKSVIEEGTELVGLPEAVPIEEAVCDVTSFASKVIKIVKEINEGIECLEIIHNLKQYVSYGNTYDTTFDTYDSDIGAFAGKQYKYTKGCKALAETFEKKAFKSLVSSLLDVDNFEQITIPKQERYLENTDKYFKNPNCVYCLPEAEFIDFFQGFYDGQTYLDKNMDTLDIKTCIDANSHFENAYYGGL